MGQTHRIRAFLYQFGVGAMDKKPTVAIILPVVNERGIIRDTLKHLLSLGADEVIVAVQAPISEEDLANLEQPVSAEAEKATIEAMNKEAESAKADKVGEEGETKTEGKVEAKADKVASPAEKQKK